MRARSCVMTAVAAAALLLCAPAVMATPSDEILAIAAQYGGIRNDKTPLGVTDGNPLAATALNADSLFEHYGLSPRMSADFKTDNNNWIFDISTGAGGFDSGDFDGWQWSAEMEIATRFSDTVGLSLLIPFEYRSIGSTDTFIAALDLGLPITIMPDRGQGFSWVVTPSIMATTVGISVELVQGGYLFGGGATSSLAYRSGPWTLSMANQITYGWGRPISYDSELNFDQSISQTILKNGVKGEYAFGEAFSADVSITYSNFLNDAYTDNYWTPAAGLTWHFGESSGVRVGFTSDYAYNFKTYGGELQYYVAF